MRSTPRRVKDAFNSFRIPMSPRKILTRFVLIAIFYYLFNDDNMELPSEFHS